MHPTARHTVRSVIFLALTWLALQSISLAQTPQYFPQFADGGGYVTTWYFTGFGEGSTSVTIEFFSQNGAPMSLVTDRGTSTAFDWTLGKTETTALHTLGGGGSARTGWAKVTSSRAVGAVEVFQYYRETGELISQVGVLPTDGVSNATLLVSSNTDRGTALALANPDSSPVNYSLRLLDNRGALLATSSLALGPGNHIAAYVYQIPGLERSANFEGSLEISSSSPFALVSLIFEGQNISSVPVLPGRYGTVDRAGLFKDLNLQAQQVKSKEVQFMAPAEQDLATYTSFLAQANTGLIRLLPRETYDGKLITRGGGAYYSFKRLTHEYGSGSDLLLQQGKLSVGFAGADFGFLTSLGDVAIESLTLDSPGVQYLASFVTPLKESDARQQQQLASAGFSIGSYFYQNRMTGQTQTTYALRSICYGGSDLLVVFRIIRTDTDGSIIVLWKQLKEFPTPVLQQ